MKINILLVAATALIAAPALAVAPKSPTYVAMAASSDMYEMESSKLLTGSANPRIASFAQMMVTDHAKSTDEIGTAARADGMSPLPPRLNAKHAALLASLKKTEGAKRDTLYLKQQVTSHKEALALHQSYADGGDMPRLKAAAATIVPVVQTHLTEVTEMAKMKPGVMSSVKQPSM